MCLPVMSHKWLWGSDGSLMNMICVIENHFGLYLPSPQLLMATVWCMYDCMNLWKLIMWAQIPLSYAYNMRQQHPCGLFVSLWSKRSWFDPQISMMLFIVSLSKEFHLYCSSPPSCKVWIPDISWGRTCVKTYFIVDMAIRGNSNNSFMVECTKTLHLVAIEGSCKP